MLSIRGSINARWLFPFFASKILITDSWCKKGWIMYMLAGVATWRDLKIKSKYQGVVSLSSWEGLDFPEAGQYVLVLSLRVILIPVVGIPNTTEMPYCTTILKKWHDKNLVKPLISRVTENASEPFNNLYFFTCTLPQMLEIYVWVCCRNRHPINQYAPSHQFQHFQS